MLDNTEPSSLVRPLHQLQSELGVSWHNLNSAVELSKEKRKQLKAVLQGFDNGDTSIVTFGSLARDEFTLGSDLDWTLLIDGIANPEHLATARAIRGRIQTVIEKDPGREGTFGNMAFSHDLVHQIGGQDDDNANTTRRILLLLESQVIGHRSEAYERVISCILKRYLEEDRGLLLGSGQYRVPRFLLNDFARYWRTMTVDFAYKQRARNNDGFALRNIKLRMSRKLIFVSGLMACFSLETFLAQDVRYSMIDEGIEPLITHFKGVLRETPLELLAKTLLFENSDKAATTELFSAYDEFVGLLADETNNHDGKTKREHLESLQVEALSNDSLFHTARQISHRFRDAIQILFLKPDSKLGKMTIEYGVF